MTENRFDDVVKERVSKIVSTLVVKGKEYRRNNNPLHNFDIASKVNNTTREKALWGFAVKHYVSFLDILNDIEKGELPSKDKMDEKIGDLINYLILCEASILDKLEKVEENNKII